MVLSSLHNCAGSPEPSGTRQCDKYNNLMCWLKGRFKCHIYGLRVTFALPEPSRKYLNPMGDLCAICASRETSGD